MQGQRLRVSWGSGHLGGTRGAPGGTWRGTWRVSWGGGTWGTWGAPGGHLRGHLEGVLGEGHRSPSGCPPALPPPPRWSGEHPSPHGLGRHPSLVMICGRHPAPHCDLGVPPAARGWRWGTEADPQGRRGCSRSKTTGSAVPAQTPRLGGFPFNPRARGAPGPSTFPVGGAAGSWRSRGGAAPPAALSCSPALSLPLCAPTVALAQRGGIIASVSGG